VSDTTIERQARDFSVGPNAKFEQSKVKRDP